MPPNRAGPRPSKSGKIEETGIAAANIFYAKGPIQHGSAACYKQEKPAVLKEAQVGELTCNYCTKSPQRARPWLIGIQNAIQGGGLIHGGSHSLPAKNWRDRRILHTSESILEQIAEEKKYQQKRRARQRMPSEFISKP